MPVISAIFDTRKYQTLFYLSHHFTFTHHRERRYSESVAGIPIDRSFRMMHTDTTRLADMKTTDNRTQQPIITKMQQPQHTGSQAHTLSRYAIGYVVRGRKYIYYGDTRYEARAGDMFYLGIGTHYIEEIPDESRSYEQLTLFCSPELLRDLLSDLSLNYRMEFDNNHTCANCGNDLFHIFYPSWGAVTHFFGSLHAYLREDLFGETPAMERIKALELLCLLLANPDCCIRSRLLDDINMASDGFEQIVRRHIFDNMTIEDLAALCNKSLTSFKKEFLRRFHEPPHKWFLRQRLTHSRLLLISTDKSIAAIASECRFTNPSHYIKLFKQAYGQTPAVYRHLLRSEADRKREPLTADHPLPVR